MSEALRVLMILTSHATMGEGGEPTGVWFEELATPYYAFRDAGAEVRVVSIEGGPVPIDPRSRKQKGENPASVERFLADAYAVRSIEFSAKVTDVSAAGYDIVFLPGGHGTMWDLPRSEALTRLVSEAWQGGAVVSAVCHGPAGLVNARDPAGRPIVQGRRVSAFTDSEERAAGLTEKVPFLLETRLRELGARFEGGPDFQSFAVRDGRLVTGQNPASSAEVARLALEAARDRTAAPAA